MGKFILTEEDRKSIRGLYGLNEQTNSLSVSGSYTAKDCDELHAFESTKKEINGQEETVTVGEMHTKVGNKIKEWNSTGINVKPISVNVSVNGMTVNWTVTFEQSDVNWVGFTSRGAGCNYNVDYRAGNDAIDNGPKSIMRNLTKQNKTLGKMEIVDEFKYNGGNNPFKQVFYRYTLITETAKPTPQPSQPKTQTGYEDYTVDEPTPQPSQPKTQPTQPTPTTPQNTVVEEFKISATNLNTLYDDFKKKVNDYIIKEGNNNYNIHRYFSVSSKDGITINVWVNLYPDENGYNRFSLLFNEKGNDQESLDLALGKNPDSKEIKNGTITVELEGRGLVEHEWHLVGLHV